MRSPPEALSSPCRDEELFCEGKVTDRLAASVSVQSGVTACGVTARGVTARGVTACGVTARGPLGGRSCCTSDGVVNVRVGPPITAGVLCLLCRLEDCPPGSACFLFLPSVPTPVRLCLPLPPPCAEDCAVTSSVV